MRTILEHDFPGKNLFSKFEGFLRFIEQIQSSMMAGYSSAAISQPLCSVSERVITIGQAHPDAEIMHLAAENK